MILWVLWWYLVLNGELRCGIVFCERTLHYFELPCCITVPPSSQNSATCIHEKSQLHVQTLMNDSYLYDKCGAFTL